MTCRRAGATDGQRRDLRRGPGADDDDLLGIYEGIPLTERDTGYTMAFPDRITIYRLPTLRISHDADEVRRRSDHRRPRDRPPLRYRR